MKCKLLSWGNGTLKLVQTSLKKPKPSTLRGFPVAITFTVQRCGQLDQHECEPKYQFQRNIPLLFNCLQVITLIRTTGEGSFTKTHVHIEDFTWNTWYKYKNRTIFPYDFGPAINEIDVGTTLNPKSGQ